MSLLLEALKKAEKAKEEAQRRERGAAAAELRLDDAVAPEARPVLTRPELPDIKQPLEILSDDIAPRQATAEPTGATRPVGAKPEESRPQDARATERAAARNVFEAKFKEPDPRLPFFITLGALAVFALGTAVYFWYQLRPPASLLAASSVARSSSPAAVPVAVAAAAAPAPQPAAAAIPGLPAAVESPTAPAPPTVRQSPARPAPGEASAQPPARRPGPAVAVARAVEPPLQPAAARSSNPVSSRAPASPQVHPRVQSAYAAYLKGDYATARTDYQEALREESTNRDALLGLAATDMRAGRLEVAEATYLRLLQLDPRDSHAQAGLIALRASRLDPLATESRVKSMLAADPAANVLHFTLGNQLAQQGRWSEAQQEYFKAFAANPDNPDFAYNLAVSLDHLRQGKLALEYYRRAIALAEQRPGSFDLAAARERASQLEK